ncbi:hypothetical protein [Solibacillus sp. FSL K6-1523]|uniref:hypothetical protein n=1 Tax=Solibacillus sp. FSL K6-1523 TaxID=2921471 RepID=UPI0030FCF7DB
MLKKTTNLIGDPVVSNNRVTFTVSPTARFTQHAKYLNPDFKSPDDILRTQAKTRITGFAYACPGYYTSRIYSDMQGRNLLGYIQVYVSEADIKNSKCDKVNLPGGTPPPTPEKPDPPITITPPAPKPIHPVPDVDVVIKNTKPTTPKVEKLPPTKPVDAFQSYCDKNYYPSGYKENGSGIKYERMPGTGSQVPPNDKSHCCPIAHPNGTPITVMSGGEALFSGVFKGPQYAHDGFSSYVEGEWVCGVMKSLKDLKDCGNGILNEETDMCEEITYTGNPGNYPLEMEEYYTEENDVSEMGVFSSGGEGSGEESEPPPTGPPTEEKSCEEDPDQDHCPPPCYCEDMGDWGYMCCIFECPGWDDYLGFLSGTIVGSASPPPVPDLPAPSIPNIFDILNGVDERNPAKPTGNEDPNLGNASFNANDIKNEAPEIQFRDDPTGGFNIVNPLETLPDDGSEAPRPQEDLETLPYPDGSGKNLEGDGSIPKPEGSGSDGKVKYPVNPEGTATPPTTGGKAEYPETGGTIKYPGT